MAEKFNLADALKEVSKLDTDREQIEYIDIDLLDSDDRNFYQLSDLDQLVSNIELIGLQQPIRVREHPEQAGRYIVVSGHRRRAALQALVEDGKTAFRDVPCIREQKTESSAMQELRLIFANSGTRKLTPAEIARQAERVEMLLYELKEEGIEFPGRMRDHVAEACKVSKSKLARLKVIRDNLVPDFMVCFEKNTILESVAYGLARLPQDFQTRIFRAVPLKSLTGQGVESILEKYASGWRWETQLSCPDGKPCTHADAALHHDLTSRWSLCGAAKCCLECPQATQKWSHCERMCSKAKAKRTAAAAEEKEKEEKEMAKATNKYQRQTQRNAQRLLPVIDAAGLSNSVRLEWNRYGYYTVKTIRRFAAGDFEDTGTWYSAKFSPDIIYDPKKLAQTLNCTTDFLFGLTDDPRRCGASGWMSGEALPPAPGDMLVDIAIGGGSKPLRKLCWFDGSAFRYSNGADEIGFPVIRWLAIPPVNKADEN